MQTLNFDDNGLIFTETGERVDDSSIFWTRARTGRYDEYDDVSYFKMAFVDAASGNEVYLIRDFNGREAPNKDMDLITLQMTLPKDYLAYSDAIQEITKRYDQELKDAGADGYVIKLIPPQLN